ncbi:uncharacterized protein BO66DRAFT_400733 [Aspergillus aculeatinus CBS 121060]|uniref:Uncharacterized protein n=1 Tax=Aspergillus aculeatinus CBS 121060 TaxID=1448322 RepID=A0ACD1HCQ4_9EURO|nr:hypothetical protein BO66DRAFT_400733 [Aspergillus aculeatinus CBS 121060]RAH71200.1 hypothetical protein BO66DRAFT_400733 [Aspergillus aculeatinus CBS 121060]
MISSKFHILHSGMSSAPREPIYRHFDMAGNNSYNGKNDSSSRRTGSKSCQAKGNRPHRKETKKRIKRGDDDIDQRYSFMTPSREREREREREKALKHVSKTGLRGIGMERNAYNRLDEKGIGGGETELKCC